MEGKIEVWSKDVVDTLKKLFHEGLHQTEIANILSSKFDAHYTAAMVNGKAYRLHIKRGHASISLNATLPKSSNPKIGKKKEVSISSDGTITAKIQDKLPEDFEERINQPNKNSDYLAQLAGYDPKEYGVITSGYSTWEMPSKKGGTRTLYALKVKVRRRKQPAIDMDTIAEIANNSIKQQVVSTKSTGTKDIAEDNLFIPMSDWHLGWTKYEDLQDKLVGMVDTINERPHGEITFAILGDWFHSNSFERSITARGTQLDHADMYKAVSDSFKILDFLFSNALEHANKVTLQLVRGNHDNDTLQMFEYALKYKYPQVNVVMPRKGLMGYRAAFLLGNVGILITHGDTARKHLKTLFATEFKDIWVKAKAYNIFSGHYHHENFTDEDGVEWYELGCPKPYDNYESKLGLTNSKKVSYIFEYGSDKLKAIHEY